VLHKITYLIEKQRVKRHLDKIRTGKPSLSQYYAAYMLNKPLKTVTPSDIYRAERALIPLVLRYYLDSSLNWEGRVDMLISELSEFYFHFCRRKKRWSFKDKENPLDENRELMNIVKFVTGNYDIKEALVWCDSPVPRSKYA
jgi:hypothetical protein